MASIKFDNFSHRHRCVQYRRIPARGFKHSDPERVLGLPDRQDENGKKEYFPMR